MMAFSDFVVHAAKITFGQSVDARANVAGVGRGSFVADLIFQVAGATATVLSVVDGKTLWVIVKEALSVWKHLRGSPPRAVEYQGQTAQVTNNNGEIKQVSIQSLVVVFSDKASDSVQQFIHKALEKPGMDSMELKADDKLLARVAQSERGFFVPVTPVETVTDVTVPMALILEGPVFKEDNKWRFYDGQQSFYATMEDREFLARVDAGEPFRKGDVVVADVRITQERSGAKLTAERSIVKVRDHRRSPLQLSLVPDGGPQ